MSMFSSFAEVELTIIVYIQGVQYDYLILIWLLSEITTFQLTYPSPYIVTIFYV